ncbi:hypothetical protein RHGRI_017285 [Rhododendron griersonianum]|uniref:Uncharacterized protein n=1 Tax=Rhododendron griersonianum TaxID=479676 RepID=A0AAV6JXC2_9ERIC|nr:hypothetical protein RHGRI_017285 [Rhododendron griersonianum]
MAVLERRMVKRGNKAVVQWLVQWMNSIPEGATWVDHSEIEAKYPHFQPRGQGGNVTSRLVIRDRMVILYFHDFRELVRSEGREM